jgi:hypothetical protein
MDLEPSDQLLAPAWIVRMKKMARTQFLAMSGHFNQEVEQSQPPTRHNLEPQHSVSSLPACSVKGPLAENPVVQFRTLPGTNPLHCARSCQQCRENDINSNLHDKTGQHNTDCKARHTCE